MPTSGARIGYINLLESGTVVASSEDSSFPVANCYDWLTSDFFKPTSIASAVNIDLTLSVAASADYFAFYGQDLYSKSGTIKLQYWNGSSYVDCFTAISPTDNTPQFKSFTSQSSTKWRVVVTATSIFSLGVISFGPQLALEYGMYLDWSDPIFARDTQLITSRADKGAFLGRSVVSNGIATNLVLQGASDAWMRTNWVPFVKAIEKRGFFFVPNITSYPAEAAFCWVEEKIPAPNHTHYGYMGASIPIRGLVE